MSPAQVPAAPLTDGPQAFLDAYGAVAEPLRKEHAQAYWRFATRGDSSAQQRLGEIEQFLSDQCAQPGAYDAMLRWLDDGPEPVVARQLRILLPEFRSAQVERGLRERIIQLGLQVEEVHGVFRATLDGRPVTSNQLDGILLREADDGRRRRAWEATRAVGGQVADRVRELARLRNEQARAVGFDDYFALALDDEEMDPAVLGPLLDDLEARTDEPWARCKAALDAEFGALRGKAPSDLQPWDYTDRFLQSVPRAGDGISLDPWFRPSTIERFARRYFSGIGQPIDKLWANSDMLPRDRKHPHAFCIGVDNPSDVRVLCNLDSTQRWMETTLHEFGHAIYNAGIDPELPWLLREAAHTFVTEAVAMYFGRLARSPRWLHDVAGVPVDRAEAAAAQAAEGQLVFLRWAMVVVRFEQAMYRDPEGDFVAAWWSIVNRLQGLRRPDGWAGADWASKVHVACYPAYYQNYILGELLASQFGARLGEGAEVGAFFAELFRSGQSRPWDQTIEPLCGPLTPEPWVQEFAA